MIFLSRSSFAFAVLGIVLTALPACAEGPAAEVLAGTASVTDQIDLDAPLWEESFEGQSLNAWTTVPTETNATARLVDFGSSSAHSLELDKGDTNGFLIVERAFDVPGNAKVEISADIASLYVGPFAEYYLQVQQLDAGGAIVTQQPFAYNDGFSVSSEFGGLYKTPQTLGEWAKTRHVLSLDAKTTRLKLMFVVRNGAQKLRIDNVRVTAVRDAARQDPIPLAKPFYEKTLGTATAILDFEQFVPGFTYEIAAGIAPAEKDGLAGSEAPGGQEVPTSGTTSASAKGAVETRGMGIAWKWFDADGKASDIAELPGGRSAGDRLIYTLSIPETAVRVQLQLHNDDLITKGWGKEKEYRRWNSLAIRQVASLPAIDTLFSNYLHRVSPHPEWTKPPGLIEMTPDDITSIQAVLAKRPVVDASVVRKNGAMAIQMGDRVEPPLWAASLPTLNLIDIYGKLGEQGVNVVRVGVSRSGPAFDGMWVADGKYDFSPIDNAIYRALKQNPNAEIIFDMGGLYPPYWWGEAHPDQILQSHEGLSLSIHDAFAYERLWGKIPDAGRGLTLHEEHEKLYEGNNWLKNWGAKVNTTYYPSPASAAYRAAMKGYISALRRYIENQPYGKAVIGYQLTWGYDMQWGLPVIGNEDRKVGSATKSAPPLVDFSPPMRAYFRDYLRRTYGTEAALRAAWKDAGVSFATAEPPSPEKILPVSGQGRARYLLDPSQDRQVIDWKRAQSEVIGDLANELGLAVKAAAPRKVLVSGYFQDIARSIGTDRILTGNGIDILGGPDYTTREIGQSGISPFSAASYQLHNKISFTEIDHRLFSVMYREYRGNQVFETPRKSISVLRRETGRQLVEGDGAWVLDMGFGWYNQPILAGEMGNIRRVWAAAQESDRGSVARVALFVGDYTKHARASEHVGRLYYLEQYVRSTLSQSGIAYDVYQMDDLAKVGTRYDVCLFPSAYALTASDRKAIEALKKDGRLLVFGPGAGYLSDENASDANVQALTGMDVQRDDTLPLSVKWRDDNPLIKGVSGYLGSEDTGVEAPTFAVTDPAAVSLADYAGHPGKTGIAYRNMGAWQSLYLGSIGLYPSDLWRGIARLKGVHVYNAEGDAVWASKSLVAVHAAFDGIHTIDLPSTAQVTDLWSGKEYGSIPSLKVKMKTGDNLLLRLR